MELLKTVTAKVVGGIVGLIVVIAAISWWRMDTTTRDMLLTGTGKILGWLGIVIVVPWATFFLIGAVGRLASNAAGAALVLFYTAAEATMLAWLFSFKMPTSSAWTFYILGVLLAGVYNLLICDWIAEKVA